MECDYYYYKVKGILVYGQGNTVINKRFEEKFVLPFKDEAKARMIIQNKLLSAKLGDWVEYYKRWRTCKVIEVRKANNREIESVHLDPSKIEEMNLSQLCQLAINLDLKTDPALKSSLEEARWAIEDEVEERKLVNKKTEEVDDDVTEDLDDENGDTDNDNEDIDTDNEFDQDI